MFHTLNLLVKGSANNSLTHIAEERTCSTSELRGRLNSNVNKETLTILSVRTIYLLLVMF